MSHVTDAEDVSAVQRSSPARAGTGRPHLRRGILAVAVLGVLAAIAVAVVAFVLLRSQPGAGGGASGSPAAMSQQDVQRLETDLSSPDVATQVQALVPGLRVSVVANGRLLLPTGSRVTIDPASLVVVGPGTGEVSASVRGPQPGQWSLFLADDGAGWLVYGTRQR